MPILVWCLDGAERMKGWKRLFSPALRIGFAFGLGYFTAALHWLGAAFLQEGGLFILLMPFAILGLAAVLALFWAVATALAHASGRVAPCGWFCSPGPSRSPNMLAANLFSGFPFDLLGYAFTANDEMAQAASVIGVYGLTFLAALASTTIALIWPADERGLVRRLVPFFLSIGLIAGQIGYGSWRLENTAVTQRNRHEGTPRPADDHRSCRLERCRSVNVMDRLISLSESGTGLEDITHLVWPESVFPFFIQDYPDALARIARMLPPGTTLLTGAPRAPLADELAQNAENPGFNSILAIANSGEIVGSYDKSHLVPFGEYLPFAEFWKRFGIRQFVPGTNGWAPGDGRRLMADPRNAALPGADLLRGGVSRRYRRSRQGRFILNITNDAWFDGSIGPPSMPTWPACAVSRPACPCCGPAIPAPPSSPIRWGASSPASTSSRLPPSMSCRTTGWPAPPSTPRWAMHPSRWRVCSPSSRGSGRAGASAAGNSFR